MLPFTTLTAIAAPLPIDNVDTDMIIPKQFLKTIKRTGLKEGLFYEMRLMSPAMAVAAAVTGHLADVREII